MTDRVDPTKIEQFVGARRHSIKHLGLVDSTKATVFILHSSGCVARNSDLRKCSFSRALDEGITLEDFVGFLDRAIVLAVSSEGLLLPAPIAAMREGSSGWGYRAEPVTYL